MQGRHIKVSVIMPVFNCETYLEQCLDSLKAQALKEAEYLLINDGSTDGSLDILNRYAQEDGRFHVITMAGNVGAGAARNAGLKAAQGEYLLFLDSDDVFEPDLLSHMYEACKKEDADIGICEADAFAGDINIRSPFCAFNKGIKVLLQGRGAFDYSLFATCIFSLFGTMTWNKLYKKEFILDNHIYFQEIPSINDLYFMCTAITKAARMVLCEGFYVHYRKGRDRSISRKSVTDTKQYYNSMYEALMALQKRLKEDGIFDFVKDSYVNTALMLATPILWNAAAGLDACHYVYNFYKEKLFSHLSIGTGNEAHFYHYTSFSCYTAILHSSAYEEMAEVMKTVPGIYEKNAELLNDLMAFLSRKSYKTALWGYGEKGESFYRTVEEHGCIDYIIDRDPGKQGKPTLYGRCICSYETVGEEIDVILITTSSLYTDVLHQVEMAGRDTVVFDIEFYLMTRNMDYVRHLLDR